MLSWDLRSHRAARPASGPVFFDRGVVDVLGYLPLVGVPAPEHVKTAVALFRYNRKAFIAPPWKEIFETDRERKQDFRRSSSDL